MLYWYTYGGERKNSPVGWFPEVGGLPDGAESLGSPVDRQVELGEKNCCAIQHEIPKEENNYVINHLCWDDGKSYIIGRSFNYITPMMVY